jgi:hypothetical protein
MKNKDDLIKYIYDWIKEEAAIDNLNENIVVDKYGIQIDWDVLKEYLESAISAYDGGAR